MSPFRGRAAPGPFPPIPQAPATRTGVSNPYVQTGFGRGTLRQISFKGNWCFDFREFQADRRRIPGYGDNLPDDELLLLVPPDGGVTPEMMYRNFLGRDLGRPRG